jgi:hypothetical protein
VLKEIVWQRRNFSTYIIGCCVTLNDRTYIHTYVHVYKQVFLRGPVVSSPPATEETGAMGREIESRQGIAFNGEVLGALVIRWGHNFKDFVYSSSSLYVSNLT